VFSWLSWTTYFTENSTVTTFHDPGNVGDLHTKDVTVHGFVALFWTSTVVVGLWLTARFGFGTTTSVTKGFIGLCVEAVNQLGGASVATYERGTDKARKSE
jgi:hypothetical protein